MEVDIYDGDIIFCTDKDKFLSWGDESGAYLCIDGCYKRLMYTLPAVATSVVANPISSRTSTMKTVAIVTTYSILTTESFR